MLRWTITALIWPGIVLTCLGQTAEEGLQAQARAAEAAERRGDFRTAIREYESIAQALPQSAEVESNLGVAYYFAGDDKKALESLSKAEKLKRSLSAPHLFSGLVYYREGKPEQAVSELSEAASLGSTDSVASLYLGYAYSDQHRCEQAVRSFEQVEQLDPRNVDAPYAAGKCYLELGQAASKELLQAAPDGGRIWELAGEQFELRGNSKEALTLYDGALERRPDLKDVRERIAKLGGKLQMKSQGKSTLGDTREDALYGKAHGYEQSAQDAFESVMRIAPDSYRAHEVLADSAAAAGKTEEAMAEYRAVLERKPDLAGIHEAIGDQLMRTGKAQEALAEYQQELRMKPASDTARVGAARALLTLGEDNRAEAMLKTATAASSGEGLKLMGKIYLQRNEYPNAISALHRYLKRKPDDPTAYYLLLQAYRGTGDTADMQRAASRYRELSQGAKQRSEAQKAIESFERPESAGADSGSAEAASRLP